jgi:hypothetical protein
VTRGGVFVGRNGIVKLEGLADKLFDIYFSGVYQGDGPVKTVDVPEYGLNTDAPAL